MIYDLIFTLTNENSDTSFIKKHKKNAENIRSYQHF